MALNFERHNARGGMQGAAVGRALTILIEGEPGDDLPSARETLRAMGFDTVTPASLVRQPDAILSFAPLQTPVEPGVPHLAVGHPGAADCHLRAGAHAVQIGARLRSMIRLSVLETVARQRARDAAAAGCPVPPPAPPEERPCVLFVGAPSPAFMRLQHALALAQADIVAAFSTFNAFDYLHERPFDAVVLNTEPKPDLAHTICSAMRRNTRLYHTPALLLVRGEGYPHADEAFARGASDLLDAGASSEEMRDRVTALTGERRRRRAAKALLTACRSPALLEGDSDLYNPGFGARHVQSLLDSAAVRGQGLSLIGFRAAAPADAGDRHAASAFDQFASMLRYCVRAEDLAVRSGRDAFYVALPHTRPDEARQVAARVSAIAECTAYEGRDPARPFRLSLATRVFEAAPGWTGADASSAALAPFGPRAVAAAS